jgi:hypothetical protein
MPYYKLERSARTRKGKSPLESARGLNFLIDPEGGQLLIHTKKQLPEAKGLEKITKRAFDTTHRKIVHSAPQTSQIPVPLPGMDHLENVEEWCVESYSRRQADFAFTAVTAGVPAMRIQFGAGRDDTIQIGRPLKLPDEARNLVFKGYAWCSGDESVAVGPVFTTEQERPWLEIAPVEVSLGATVELQFNFTGLDRTNLAKTDRLNLAVVTEADEGFLIIERMYLAE